MTKTFVEFFYPGSFMSETSVEEISDRLLLSNVPKRAFAYRFFDITQVETADGEILKGERKNFSGMYYPDGTLHTAEDFDPVKDRILLSNMKSNNRPTVVRTRLGNIQPFIPGKDKII